MKRILLLSSIAGFFLGVGLQILTPRLFDMSPLRLIFGFLFLLMGLDIFTRR